MRAVPACMALCRKNLPIPLSVRSTSSMQISSTPTGSLSSIRSLVTTDSIPYSIDGKNVAARPLCWLEGRCGLVRKLCPDLSLGASFCFAAGFPEAAQEVHLGSKNLGWQNGPMGLHSMRAED